MDRENIENAEKIEEVPKMCGARSGNTKTPGASGDVPQFVKCAKIKHFKRQSFTFRQIHQSYHPSAEPPYAYDEIHEFFYKQRFLPLSLGVAYKKSLFGLKFCLSVAYFMTV